MDVIDTFGPRVRRVRRPDWDIVVQVLADGEWQDRAVFNEMSDDYAYTNSRNSAWYWKEKLRAESLRA